MRDVKIRRFSVDRSLGYLIQNSTNDPTHEILNYFYSIARFVLSDLIETSKAGWIKKDVILFYKDSPISYRMQLSGPGRHGGDERAFQIDVAYPKDSDCYDVTEMLNAAVESGLGLTDENNMPAFEKPILRTPRCLKQVRIAHEQLQHRKEEPTDS